MTLHLGEQGGQGVPTTFAFLKLKPYRCPCIAGCYRSQLLGVPLAGDAVTGSLVGCTQMNYRIFNLFPPHPHPLTSDRFLKYSLTCLEVTKGKCWASLQTESMAWPALSHLAAVAFTCGVRDVGSRVAVVPPSRCSRSTSLVRKLISA